MMLLVSLGLFRVLELPLQGYRSLAMTSAVSAYATSPRLVYAEAKALLELDCAKARLRYG